MILCDPQALARKLVFRDVEEMLTSALPAVGEMVHTCYHSKVDDRGGASYVVQATAQTDVTLPGVAGHFKLSEPELNVNMFGAGCGEISDAEIQAAIDFSRALGEPYQTVHFLSDLYLVENEIDRTGSGVYIDLKGQGERNTIIRAVSPINSIFKLAGTGDIAGRTSVCDMTLDANDMADYCIDAQWMRYWTYENLETMDAVEANILRGNWTVRSYRNRMIGKVGVRITGVPWAPTSSNSAQFCEDDFTQLDVGVEAPDFINDLHFNGCSFDACRYAGIAIKSGIRKLTVDDCTFEDCGNGSGAPSLLTADLQIGQTVINLPTGDGSQYPSTGELVIGCERVTFTRVGDVLTITRATGGTPEKDHPAGTPIKAGAGCVLDTLEGVTAAMAPIIIGYNKSSATITSSSFDINENTFVKSSDANILVYSVKSGKVLDNTIIPSSYVGESLVELRDIGSNNSHSGRLTIQGMYPPDLLRRILKEIPNNPAGKSWLKNVNIEARNYRLAANNCVYFCVNDMSADEWTNTGHILKQDFSGVSQFVLTDPARPISTYSIPAELLQCIVGRYLRVHFMCKGANGAAGGIDVNAYANGSNTFYAGRSQTQYSEAGRHSVFWVPDTTTALQLTFQARSAGYTLVTGFSIHDAAIDIDSVQYQRFH